MPVAFNNGTNVASGSTGGGSTVTQSYTCSSGADRLLLVMTRGSMVSSAASYAGAGMTFVADNGNLRLWRKTAPATGANNIVITLASYQNTMLSASDWTGVDQTNPLGTPVGGSGTASYFSTGTLTCPTDGAIWGCGTHGYTTSPGTWTSTGGTSIGWTRSASTGFGQASAYRTSTGAISWNLFTSIAYGYHMIPINAVLTFTAKLPKVYSQAVQGSVL